MSTIPCATSFYRNLSKRLVDPYPETLTAGHVAAPMSEIDGPCMTTILSLKCERPVPCGQYHWASSNRLCKAYQGLQKQSAQSDIILS